MRAPNHACEPADGTVVRMHMDDPRLLAFGLPPETDYDYVLELLLDGEACESASGSFRTGPSAPGAPSFEVDVPSDDLGWVLTTQATHPTGPVLLDTNGHVLWFWPDGPQIAHATAARLAPDRRSVLYGVWGNMTGDNAHDQRPGELVRVSIDGTEVDRLPTTHLHHDLVERPNGKIAYLGTREWTAEGDDRPWRTDLLVERFQDATEHVVWNASTLFPYDPATSVPTENQETTHDWTHANAIEYDPDHDAYLISFRWRDCIVKVDEHSGAVLWVFGGPSSDFTLIEGSFPTDQHGFTLVGDRLLVFDNGSADESDSRAVEYRLDPSTMTARQTWEYRRAPARFDPALGDVHLAHDDGRLVTWSFSGEFTRVDADGRVSWNASTPFGDALGYSDWLTSLQPAAGAF